jgi:hypothetical protein
MKHIYIYSVHETSYLLTSISIDMTTFISTKHIYMCMMYYMKFEMTYESIHE